MPTADIHVPNEVSRLTELAYNLWWTWTPRARRLFASIDKQLWARYRNPVQLLINIEPHAWRNLIEDGGQFISDYRRVIREFDAYMKPGNPTWFQRNCPDYKGGPVAYFSPEYGLHESIPIYCGGLGVLSGDHAKAASDLGVPFVGVGLLYRYGYFQQAVDPDGRQHHIFSEIDFLRLPISPVYDTTGRPLVVEVDFPDRMVRARVWQMKVGRVDLYLLDTDIEENDPADRPITAQLYVRGREMRLCQEWVLGIGGVRALRAMGLQPAVWHINEGHSAFLLLERLAEERRAGGSWPEIVERVRRGSVFTTHTPVPAGNEAFDMHLVERFLRPFCEKYGLECGALMDMARSYPEGGPQPFNLTAFALRLSRYANGVSRLHGEVARQMWSHIFTSGQKQPSAPAAGPQTIHAITNGVHVATWLGHDVRTLIEERLGRDWYLREDDPAFWEKIRELADEEIWEAHQNQKDRLIRFVRHRLVRQLSRHGKSPEELREANRALDPNVLTIGFARRFATYKRAYLLFHDYARLKNLITNPDHPVQIIFSGKAHPADEAGQELVRQIVNLAFYSELKGYVFFVENYDIRVARHLVQGVDLWLNTPRKPREASGTSGMKAAMNGALNISIADGWWPEGYNGRNGWVIGDGQQSDNDEMQDYADASALYEILEKEVIPAYYGERDNGIPRGWVTRMKESMISVIPQFSATRMLTEYVADAYCL